MSDSKPQNDPSMDDILASIRKIISDDEARAAAGPGAAASALSLRPTQPAPARSEPTKLAADSSGLAAPTPASPSAATSTPTSASTSTPASAAKSGRDDVLLLTDLVEEPPSVRPGSPAVEAAATVIMSRPAKRVVDDPKSSASPSIAPIPSPAKPAVMGINEPQPPTATPPPQATTPPPPVGVVPPAKTPTPTPTVNPMPASPPPTPPSARETGAKVSAAFERLNRVVVDAEPPPALPPAPVSTAVSGKGVEDLVREMLRPLLQEWMDKNLPSMVEKLIEREIERLARR